MKYFLITLLSLIVLLTILCIVFAGYLFKVAISRKGAKFGSTELTDMQKKQFEMIAGVQEWYDTAEKKKLEITSYDGLKICAEFIPAKENPVRSVICAHGFHASGMKDFGPILKYYHDNNTNVLIMRQRAHGESEGRYLCYGIKERYDLRDWLELLNSVLVPEKLPVYLHGVSMGCGTVVMASDIKLADNVNGVIADCGYTSPWEEFAHVLKQSFKLPPFPVLYVANVICNFLAGFDMKEVNTLDIMDYERYPMLFIHGEKDDFVPTWMGKANYERCVSKKKLVLFKDAAHALSWTSDIDLYQNSLKDFMEECETK